MRRAGPLLFLIVVGAACSPWGNSGASIDPSQLNNLVLQPRDLPQGFIRFDEGRQVMADLPGGRRSSEDRFGREGGWKARYRRPGTARTQGPLVVESRADAFASGEGADDELDAIRADHADAELDWRSVEVPDVGDESLAMTVVQPSAATTAVRFYLVAWRDENVAASLIVSGFDNRVRLLDALELARKQQRHIAEAAES